MKHSNWDLLYSTIMTQIFLRKFGPQFKMPAGFEALCRSLDIDALVEFVACR